MTTFNPILIIFLGLFFIFIGTIKLFDHPQNPPKTVFPAGFTVETQDNKIICKYEDGVKMTLEIQKVKND